MHATDAGPGERPLILIQARLGSSRLPGKVLLRAGDFTLLEHLVRRVRLSRYQPEIVIATTATAYDDRLALAARELGVGCVRGPTDDVLARFTGALKQSEATTIVRLTADCPLLDPAELDRVLDEFSSRLGTDAEVDYASNQAGDVRRIPRGQDVEVMLQSALCTADRDATEPGDREHVTPYLYRVPGRFRTLVTHRPGADLSRFRLTVDTEDDLALVRHVVDALGADAMLDSICEWLSAHPEVSGLNRAVAQKTIESEAELRIRRTAGRTLIARADGGQTIGSGHLGRAEALLDAWTELGGRAILLGTGVSHGQADRLQRAGIELRSPERGDAMETVAVAREAAALAVVVDGYDFGPEYQSEVARQIPLLAIDDLASFAPAAPLVVNQNAGVEAAAYGQTSSELLLGAAYILLRRGLRTAVATLDPERVTSRVIGVSFGGADPCSLSLPTAVALLDHLPDHGVWVVLGGATSADQRERLAALSEQNARLSVLHDVTKLEDVFARLSVLVAAAGTTAYEALSLAVPCVLMPTVENQRLVARGLEESGAAIVLGAPDATQAAERAARLANDSGARAQLSQRGRALVDGRGVWRVIDAVLNLVDRWEPGS